MSIGKQSSIIGLIRLFFVVVFVLVNLLFWVAGEYLQSQKLQDQLYRFMAAHRLLMRGGSDIGVFGVKIVQEPLHRLLVSAKILKESQFGDIVLYEGRVFFLHRRPPPPPHTHIDESAHRAPPPFGKPPLLEDVKYTNGSYFVFVVIGVDVLLLLFFLFLMKKLLPLRALKESIDRFNDGDKLLDIAIESDNEIASVAVSFNGALEKISSMREARGVFLRNILHELKTPIMKGFMLCDLQTPDAKRLKLIFEKMNHLLDEVVKMERFSSQEWILNRCLYRFVDIFDHSCDILLCEKDNFEMIIEDDGVMFFVDFELFAIAIKNLMDNALRYSKERPRVLVADGVIRICSYGDELDGKFLDFTKTFNREYENSSSGLGLGLYVTNAIAKKHGFALRYEFANGWNCFVLNL